MFCLAADDDLPGGLPVLRHVRPSSSTTRIWAVKPSRPQERSRSGWSPFTARMWSSWERKVMPAPSVCP